MSLSVTLILWLRFPSFFGGGEIKLRLIFILCCLSVGVYPILGAGWSSTSKYALLGRLRAVAQTISYEVSIAIILLSYVILLSSFDFEKFLQWNFFWFLWLSLPLSFVWFISSLAETNRTPFDFSEGESELVSGFNTEFSSGGFALFFLAEYGRILFIRLLFSLIFLGRGQFLFLFIQVVVVAFIFVWVRGTLPRLRYDRLIILAWKTFLPISLRYLLFFTRIKSIINFYL